MAASGIGTYAWSQYASSSWAERMDFLSAYGICIYYLPESFIMVSDRRRSRLSAYLTGQRNDGTVLRNDYIYCIFCCKCQYIDHALLLEAVGYDPTLGSMGQLAGVPEKIKMLGGAWPMIGALLSLSALNLFTM